RPYQPRQPVVVHRRASTIASIASAPSIPGRSFAKIPAAVTSTPVASSCSCGTKTSKPSTRSAAAHSSMNERS
ncbi:MAG: hypothetical protein ABJD24_00620, partial [Acidimicrobiales bacterium]